MQTYIFIKSCGKQKSFRGLTYNTKLLRQTSRVLEVYSKFLWCIKTKSCFMLGSNPGNSERAGT